MEAQVSWFVNTGSFTLDVCFRKNVNKFRLEDQR